MRSVVPLIFVALQIAGVAVCFCFFKPGHNQHPLMVIPGPSRPMPSAVALLTEVSALAITEQQPRKRKYVRFGFILRAIANAQMRAEDWDGARKSVRASDRGGTGFVKLSELLARDGQWDVALDVLREHDVKHHWNPTYIEGLVRLEWIDYLISHHELGQAIEATEQLQTVDHQREAWRKLAVACSKCGHLSQTEKYCALYVDSVLNDTRLKDYDRARALAFIERAQLSVGLRESAKATDRVLENYGFWGMVRSAEIRDQRTAGELLNKAISLANELETKDRFYALQSVGVAQAKTGNIRAAGMTARLLSEKTHGMPSNEGDSIIQDEIVRALIDAGDARTALRLTLSIEGGQCRDESLDAIVSDSVKRRNHELAIAASGHICDPSKKALAMLTIANAYAKAGNVNAAANIAMKVQIPRVSRSDSSTFDYRLPRTWGRLYNWHGGTISSHEGAADLAAEVAAQAMILSLMLDQSPTESYAELFSDLEPKVLRAIGRAHAAAGRAREAVKWARQIKCPGTGESFESEDVKDRTTELRIYSLLGVAEGILDFERVSPLAQSW